jgi:hypothetical protein
VYTSWVGDVRLPGSDAMWSQYSHRIEYRRQGVYSIQLQCQAQPDPGGTGWWPDNNGGNPLKTFYGCWVGGVETVHSRTGSSLTPPTEDPVVKWSDYFIVEVPPDNLASLIGLFAKAYLAETVEVQFSLQVRVTRLGDVPGLV